MRRSGHWRSFAPPSTASVRGQARRAARLIVTGPGVFAVRVARGHQAGRNAHLHTRIAAGVARCCCSCIVPRACCSDAAAGGDAGRLAGIAAVSLAFGSVHGITLGFGATLIGEAVDYAIYLFTNAAAGPHAAGDAAARLWRTLGWAC